MAFQKRVLSKTFVTNWRSSGRLENMHNVFCGFHFSSCITGVIACQGANYIHGSDDAYRDLVARPAGKKLLG
jgi:hypothetical protein